MENEDEPTTAEVAADVTSAEPPSHMTEAALAEYFADTEAEAAAAEAEAEALAIPQEIYNQIDPVGYDADGRQLQRTQEEIDAIARSMMATEDRLQGNMSAGLQGLEGMNFMEIIQQFFGMGGGDGNTIQNRSARIFEGFQNGDLTTAGDMPAGGVAEGLVQDILNMVPQGPTPQAPATDPRMQTPGM